MLSLEKACIILPQYRKFVECNLDFEYLSASFPQLALDITQQILNKELVTSGDSDEQQTAFSVIPAME